MKKKLATLTLIALTLTGCGGADEPRAVSPAGYEEVHKTLTDGRAVVCVVTPQAGCPATGPTPTNNRKN